MQNRNLMMVSLLAALYGGQALAAEPVVAPAAEKAAPATRQKAKKHKKDCVEKDGKPCHLSKHADTAAGKESKLDKAPLESIKSAVPAVAPVAAAAAKPEAKADAVLPDAEGRKLAQQSGCLVCHAIDKKVVGPAWKDVAAKYRGDAGAEARLIAKVAKGGSGAWGTVPMPANSPRVSDADIKALVKFALSLK